MSLIRAIGCSVPEHKYDQQEIADFMSVYLDADEKLSRQLNILYRKTAIQSRHSVLPDFHERNGATHLFNGKVPAIDQRMKLFGQRAPDLAIQAIEECCNSDDLKKVTHLITTTCTGLSAPGLEIELSQRLGLPTQTTKLSVNFMGCYAAFHALKIADAICNSHPEAHVLIVCVELCSLHFTQSSTEDNLRANALFADGAASVLVSSQPSPGSIELKAFYNELMPQGADDMTWEIGQQAFTMRLTSYIPNLVKEGIGNLLQGALQKLDLTTNDIDHWAIHPGGKKILDSVGDTMQLPPERLDAPRAVLAQYGNMSSPTILFVLKEILDRGVDSGETIFASGFGPGLTLESCVMQKV